MSASLEKLIYGSYVGTIQADTDILDALVRGCNVNECDILNASYLRIKEVFGNNAHSYFIPSYEAAIVLGIASFLKRSESIICDTTSALWHSPAGSFELLTQGRLLPSNSGVGKITIEHIKNQLSTRIKSFVKGVSLSQPTAFGIVYSKEELKKICHFAHQNSLFVHMDGVDLAYAAAFLQCSLAELTSEVGIDVLSFGGPSLGVAFGYVVIFFSSPIHDFEKIVDIGMQRIENTALIAAQYDALLAHNLWHTHAQHALESARFLASSLEKIDFVDIGAPQQTNVVNARISGKEYIWRTSYMTNKDDINALVSSLKDGL